MHGSISSRPCRTISNLHAAPVSTSYSCSASKPVRAIRVTCWATPSPASAPSTSQPSQPFAQDDTAPSSLALKPLPLAVENPVDDPSLHNPLKRQERLSTGWMGVITELDGVCVEDTGDMGIRSWAQLANEEGKSAPALWQLKKADGMKNEQVIQEVFVWTRNPMEVRRLARKREEIFDSLLGDRKPMVASGVLKLLETLRLQGVPVALVSASPELRVRGVLDATGLEQYFDSMITADDVARGRPDPEAYLYAAQNIGRPPIRCVVIGNSNQSVEAAHEVGMQCVTVAGRSPVYELTASDLVVRQLSDISFVNLKSLFRMEQSVMPHSLEGTEIEMEEEATSPMSQTTTAVMEW